VCVCLFAYSSVRTGVQLRGGWGYPGLDVFATVKSLQTSFSALGPSVKPGGFYFYSDGGCVRRDQYRLWPGRNSVLIDPDCAGGGVYRLCTLSSFRMAGS